MKGSVQTVVWARHAGQWSRVGPPLKPSAEDAELSLKALRPVFDQSPGPCRIAILGVTPELVLLPWPPTAVLKAFDHSADMIASLWQSHPQVSSSVYQADWRALPLDDASMHAAVGDGSLNALPNLNECAEVLEELHRVLVVGGRIVIRCFVRPDVPETFQEVVAAVKRSQIGSFHALKWRMAMALAGVSRASVAVADIHDAFEASFPSRDALAALTGWPREVIDSIDAYRGSLTRYVFPTLPELLGLCRPWFELQSIEHGSYELADRCPMLSLRHITTEADHE